jgi:ribulose-5-phosphate 4-epimerase/fuculose-1-phosphate aldolase
VPCVPSEDDFVVKKEYRDNPYPVNIPEGMVNRPDVYVVFEKYTKFIDQFFAERGDELDKQGLSFLVERHGTFTFAKDEEIAIDNFSRIEAACRAYILSKLIKS